MKRNLLLLLITICLIFLSYQWISLKPSIEPNDIVLKGVIKENRFSPEPKLPTKDGYVIEIKLDKKTSKKLYISDSSYFYEIFPYVNGYANSGWDFFQGLDHNGYAIGSRGYSFGVDSRTMKIAASELKNKGILHDDSDEQVNNLSNQHLGFSYTENIFPTKVRIYLAPTNKPLVKGRYFLIYSHYETRWGKNLSWAKLVPLEIERK